MMCIAVTSHNRSITTGICPTERKYVYIARSVTGQDEVRSQVVHVLTGEHVYVALLELLDDLPNLLLKAVKVLEAYVVY